MDFFLPEDHVYRFKTVNITDATPNQLDWLVGTLHKEEIYAKDRVYTRVRWVDRDFPDEGDYLYSPTTDGCEIVTFIEREGIAPTLWPNQSDENLRWRCMQQDLPAAAGSTLGVAVMRCYLLSKVGPTGSVPDCLK
jgi:hypothetical protein